MKNDYLRNKKRFFSKKMFLFLHGLVE